MKTRILYVFALLLAIGGQNVPGGKPIGTNPGTERRNFIHECSLGAIGGQQGAPRTNP